MTLTTGDGHAPGCQRQRRWRKDGARAMTPKERIKVHVQIERENARKLREWKEGGKRHDVGANEG